jgi:hypothetical protein
MDKIRKLGVVSFAKFQAVLGGLLGGVCGIFYAVGGLVVDSLVSFGWIASSETPGWSLGTILAFGALIGMPVIGVAVGFILGLIEAWLYNAFAKWFGGISLKIEQ